LHWRRVTVGGNVADGLSRFSSGVRSPEFGVCWFRFPPEVIVLAVRWYLRFGLSDRDVEELLAERGIEVDASPCTDGCSASPCCSLVRAGRAATPLVIVGTWTRPT
jgi:hypothetical protein